MTAVTTPVAAGQKIGENTGPGGALVEYVTLLGADATTPVAPATQGGQAGILTAIQALAAFVDGLEDGQAGILAAVQALAPYLDGVEGGLAAVVAKLTGDPSTGAGQTAQAAATALIGTRAYSAGLARVTVGATDQASVATSGTEVLLHPSTRCFVRVGAPATTSDIPLEAGEKFHLRCAAGSVIHVIRDTADGFLNIVPVA